MGTIFIGGDHAAIQDWTNHDSTVGLGRHEWVINTNKRLEEREKHKLRATNSRTLNFLLSTLQSFGFCTSIIA
jgi:hypothetical protein